MELPFLSSKFTAERDCAALLGVLPGRSHQAKPDSSAQIYLPDDFSTGSPGRLRSLPLEDPLERTPHKLRVAALKSLALQDSVAFSARETTEDALYSTPPTSAASPTTPGVTATVALAHGHHRGVFMTMGAFKMRRAWGPSARTKSSRVEGFFSVHIVYCSRLYRRRTVTGSVDVRLPFWGIHPGARQAGREGGRSGLGRP